MRTYVPSGKNTKKGEEYFTYTALVNCGFFLTTCVVLALILAFSFWSIVTPLQIFFVVVVIIKGGEGEGEREEIMNRQCKATKKQKQKNIEIYRKEK
ncbi:hypothetical protein K504DRAFT_97968 [Pleomassaria siparia CBS 279.74]|uniref:Transmembrane protein n=1 Tax=Pleomassaria siparia CBS 279.74 TaxID=1314801 RepID=A0A6G1JYA2_9PLEO|nr:hypothetical protein K504DRAFT_97968 [Pleomassaria siparia CBS 279.74]